MATARRLAGGRPNGVPKTTGFACNRSARGASYDLVRQVLDPAAGEGKLRLPFAENVEAPASRWFSTSKHRNCPSLLQVERRTCQPVVFPTAGQPGDAPSPNDSGQDGREPLHYYALEGDLEGVRQRLALGDLVSLPDRASWTPLHFAAQGQHPEVVKILVAAGAVVDKTDEYGNTPLWRAVFESRGDGDTIQALLAAGADPDLPNKSGVTPRDLADRIANFDVAGHLPPLA